jgi:hypothetical protein
MTRPRLGDEQLHLLLGLACPTMLLVVPDKRSRALEAKGYLKSTAKDGGGLQGITPAGLRRLADELESGGINALAKRLEAKRKAA